MKNVQLGAVIAERQLERRDAQGVEHEVKVLIGQPQPDPTPGGDWYCPFQILGLADDNVKAAFGVDAVQALTLCLQMIGAQLAHYRNIQGQKLTWLDQDSLGFPMT